MGKCSVRTTRALSLSTVAFTVCFAVWTIFSIIGIQIKQNLGLSETQFGLLVGTPILTGSLVRIVLGVWADRYGGHKILPLVMIAAGIATWALVWAETYPQFLLVALGVGLSGGSLPSALRTSRAGTRPPNRALRLASSGPATSGPR